MTSKPRPITDGRIKKNLDKLAMIGDRLRSLREKHGYSLRQVQEITGGEVSNPYLSQIENGDVTNVGAEALVALAALYGVSVDYLLGRRRTKHG